MLQEATDFLIERSVGELEACSLQTATSIRRALYSAARARLVTEVAQGNQTQASELLETLPFLLQQRLLFGCSPDLARGIDTAVDDDMDSSAAYNSVDVAASAQTQSSRALLSVEEPRRARRRLDAPSRAPAPQSTPEKHASPFVRRGFVLGSSTFLRGFHSSR